ncbi:type II toxin-antitoxin system RelE/ParE family toxin, partial [Lactobacillus mulieris]|nr:type II toxin-antitoxin system RelE/ParE family toxin [Lactobacillus mulieris]
MIKQFADKETEKIYKGNFSKKLPQNIQHIALRKLIMI